MVTETQMLDFLMGSSHEDTKGPRERDRSSRMSQQAVKQPVESKRTHISRISVATAAVTGCDSQAFSHHSVSDCDLWFDWSSTAVFQKKNKLKI